MSGENAVMRHDETNPETSSVVVLGERDAAGEAEEPEGPPHWRCIGDALFVGDA